MFPTKQISIAMRRLIGAYESALRDKEAELESIIYRTPFMLIRLDRDLRYRFISQAYLELTGRQPEHVIGKRLIDILGERDFQKIRPYVDKVLQGERVEFDREVDYRGGGTRFLHVVYTPENDATGRVTGWIASMIDITERKRAEQEQMRAAEAEKILVRELQHRTNNLLAVVQSIAKKSLYGRSSLGEARSTFEARLHALGRANHQLTESNWTGVRLNEIVRLTLEAFSARTDADGPDVILSANDAQNLSLAMHELATNAVKYGALSSVEGRVAVSWSLTSKAGKSILELFWRERGGPPVVPPHREGFGTALLKAAFKDVQFNYAKEGLSCSFELALSSVTASTAEPANRSPRRAGFEAIR